MTEKEQQREYRTVSYLCSTLANICSAPPNMVIDALTGLLSGGNVHEHTIQKYKVLNRQIVGRRGDAHA